MLGDKPMKKILYITLSLITIAVSCKKPYLPPAISAPNSYLVVEGVINAGLTNSDSTVINLSKSVNLGSAVKVNPVKGASVSIEGDQNLTLPLNETKPGYYVLYGSKFDVTHKYRLHIKTTDNKEYRSDFEAVTATPAIDSISYTTNNNQLALFANTHDPNNNTHYYRFDYTETWQFHSLYFSAFISNGTELVSRDASNFIYTCWASDTSSTILLGSSAKLKQDVISQLPVTTIVSTSEKVETKYSILLREYALSSDAYTFFSNLKKNTEQLGSIFDAQPSEITGNIHNIANAAEPVIGYISTTTIQSKRIFITKDKLPNTWATVYPYGCSLDSAYFDKPHSMPPENEVEERLILLPVNELTISAFYDLSKGIAPLGYFGASSSCADCTIRGKNKQPDFWQ
jgi:hypothetical protein